MSSDLKNKVEAILITEIEKLYRQASTPIGLSFEEIRKLEVLVKIKDLERSDKDKGDKPLPASVSVSELVRIAKGIIDDNQSGSNQANS